MGNSDSKLIFRQGIFRLASAEAIPPHDLYWQSFSALPTSADDVFSLFTATDIRRARDQAPHNIETLVRVLIQRLLRIQQHRSFPHSELAPEKDLLNALRVLTRVLPFLYESPAWQQREHRLLWEGESPLGHILLDSLIELLFFEGFTVPASGHVASRVSYAIWQQGIGCTSANAANSAMESNQVEVLRLLLVLTGKTLYVPAHRLPEDRIEALTYLTNLSDKQVVLSILCSFMNTVLQYQPSSWSVNQIGLKDSRQPLVLYSVQLLLAFLVYPTAKNQFRNFLGRLHRLSDFELMARGMVTILEHHMHAKASYLTLGQARTNLVLETIMLFWETLQCNKRFRSFIIDSHYGHTMTTLMIFFASECRADAAKQGVVRMCMFVLQTMSVESNFGRLCNQEMQHLDVLPVSLRPAGDAPSYADFLVSNIYGLMSSSKGKLDAVFPSMLATINNIAPYVEHLHADAAAKLLRLFVAFSSPQFFLANEIHHYLLEAILQSINALIEHQYMAFVAALFQHRKRFEELQNFRLPESLPPRCDNFSASTVPPDAEDELFAVDEADDETRPGSLPQSPSMQEPVPSQLRGMSEKARGKLPAGLPTFTRQNSSSSLNTYRSTPSSPLVAQSSFDLHCPPEVFRPSQAWLDQWLPALPLDTLSALFHTAVPPATLPPGVEKTPPRIHTFEWTPLSLGWYQSLLWGSIFAAEVQVQQRGTLGIWNHTKIRLFRVKADAAHSPTLREPLGAVDAVGRRLVSGVQSLRLPRLASDETA